MAGMIGDTRVNLRQDAMQGYIGLLGGIAESQQSARPIVLDTKEKLLMMLLEKLDNLKPTINIDYGGGDSE